MDSQPCDTTGSSLRQIQTGPNARGRTYDTLNTTERNIKHYITNWKMKESIPKAHNSEKGIGKKHKVTARSATASSPSLHKNESVTQRTPRRRKHMSQNHKQRNTKQQHVVYNVKYKIRRATEAWMKTIKSNYPKNRTARQVLYRSMQVTALHVTLAKAVMSSTSYACKSIQLQTTLSTCQTKFLNILLTLSSEYRQMRMIKTNKDDNEQKEGDNKQ